MHYWDPHHFVELFRAKVLHEDFGMISYLTMIVDLLVVFAMFSLCYAVTTLTLGSRPRQGLWKVVGQERKLGSESKCEGMNPHTPKGVSTLGVGILVDSRMFREQLQGSKPNGLKIF